jgi:hypothetical protein
LASRAGWLVRLVSLVRDTEIRGGAVQ